MIAQRLLQCANQCTKGRLRQMAGRRRFGEAALAGQRQKGAQLSGGKVGCGQLI